MDELDVKLQKAIDLIKKELNADTIVLFGSYARKTQSKESDIDIAIKTKKEVTSTDMFNITQRLEELLKIDVDLVNLDNISDSFRYEILMNGEILYCKDEYTFDLYKLDMFREYLELNESRKDIIENIKNGGTIYGK